MHSIAGIASLETQSGYRLRQRRDPLFVYPPPPSTTGPGVRSRLSGPGIVARAVYLKSQFPTYLLSCDSSEQNFCHPVKMALHKDSKYKLSNGYDIPVSGFGVFQTPAEVTVSVVYEALRVGYRHIDSARDYENELETAQAISKFLKENPDVKREDIFFTSKIMNKTHCTYDEAVAQLTESWERCKDLVGYFDLFLVHCTWPDSETRFNQYRALQEFVDAGRIRSIGVSNYGTRHLDELFAWEGLKHKPVINQVELQPWLPRKDLQVYGEKYGFLLEAYSPLTRGKKFDDPELVAIAEKHGKTPAEILLKWSYEQGFIPLPKTITLSRIPQNYNVLDHVELDDEDRKILSKPASYEILTWDPTTYIDPK